MTTLARCPFCGTDDVWARSNRDHGRVRNYAECMNCGARGGSADTAERATELWSRRAALSDSQAPTEEAPSEIDQLRAEMRGCKCGNCVAPAQIQYSREYCRVAQHIEAIAPGWNDRLWRYLIGLAKWNAPQPSPASESQDDRISPETYIAIRDWVADPSRKNPQLAFTAGLERSIASAVEDGLKRAASESQATCGRGCDSTCNAKNNPRHWPASPAPQPCETCSPVACEIEPCGCRRHDAPARPAERKGAGT